MEVNQIRFPHVGAELHFQSNSEQNGVIACLRISVGVLLLRNQNYLGSESRARMPVLVQVGLDSAYFETQYTEQPSCSLQAWVGPMRSGLAFAAPRGRVLRGNGTSVLLSLVISTIAPSTIAGLRG